MSKESVVTTLQGCIIELDADRELDVLTMGWHHKISYGYHQFVFYGGVSKNKHREICQIRQKLENYILRLDPTDNSLVVHINGDLDNYCEDNLRLATDEERKAFALCTARLIRITRVKGTSLVKVYARIDGGDTKCIGGAHSPYDVYPIFRKKYFASFDNLIAMSAQKN